MDPQTPVNVAPAAPVDSKRSDKPLKILLVDDEPGIRDSCSRLIRRQGYDVSTASSGEEAALRLNEGWDIILTDINMPGTVHGIELLRRARAAGSVDVIIMTAQPELDTAIGAIREGAYDYLVKPVTEEALILAVNRCVHKRQLSRELAWEKDLRAELESAYFELARMQQVKTVFGQFVTPEVAQFVLSSPQDLWKRGERRVASMLFVDVREFTPYAGSVPPEEALEALNQIFSRAIQAVTAEGGVVNKFTGDGILAFFGAPLPLSDHSEAAARAALRARDAVEELARTRSAQGQAPLRVGIGVNTGEVVAGCLGTETRTEYTVIGHSVNLCARLMDLAKPGQILTGPDAAHILQPGFELIPTAPMILAGISKPVIAYELVGRK
ncbi:MAG: adenylate/guanylate cyclase domain-containing protein [Elusimicrobiota bacterium]